MLWGTLQHPPMGSREPYAYSARSHAHVRWISVRVVCDIELKKGSRIQHTYNAVEYMLFTRNDISTLALNGCCCDYVAFTCTSKPRPLGETNLCEHTASARSGTCPCEEQTAI